MLSVETEIVDKAEWDADRGQVQVEITTTNDAGGALLTMTALVPWQRK